MLDIQIPNLTFPDVDLGAKETPWTLLPLLYKGGALVRVDEVGVLIEQGSLGRPLVSRLELVKNLHATIKGDLAGGGSQSTALGAIENIRRFFRWVDANDLSVSIDEVDTTYRYWADYLMNRVRTVKDISEDTAYAQVAQLGRYLDKSLERLKPILLTTRFKKPPRRQRIRSIQADKQNLEHTFAFGAKLLDICNGLNLDRFWGPLPIHIHLRTGEILVEHSRVGRRVWPHPIVSSPSGQRQQAKEKATSHAIHEADCTLRTRYPLANLRIEAELLTFIAQTGMNLAQAHLLRLDNYSYTSYTDGYHVRSYKNRRGGPVLFEIYAEYREIFERYIMWRKSIFLNDKNNLLFPLTLKTRTQNKAPKFERIRALSKKLGWTYIGPQKLRNTRVNWLLRRSRDPDLTAEMAQHSKETLLNIYEEPSLQVAISEITIFWQQHDPSIAPPAPGQCIGTGPAPVRDMPPTATPPDCLSPAGCLWCEHQRDIDSLDHVWALCSYRFLKTLELSAIRPPMQNKKAALPHPAEHAIERITQKLHFFKNSSEVRDQWVQEGLVRIEEGHYHPDWVGLIETL